MKIISVLRSRKSKLERNNAQVLESIREHLAFFGIDTSHLTDEEIKHIHKRFAEEAFRCGVSIEDAVSAFRRMMTFQRKMEES